MQPFRNLIPRRLLPALAFIALATPGHSATMAYLSFTGGAGSPFGITLHTSLQFEVTAPFPSTGEPIDSLYAIAFLNLGDLVGSRGISGDIQMTVNGSSVPYNALSAGLMAATGNPIQWGISSWDNNLLVYNEFMQYTQMSTPAELEAGIPGISAHLTGFPLTTGSKFEWSAGTMTTNSAITLNSSIPADGYYEVVVISASGFAPISVTAAAVPEPSACWLSIGSASVLMMRRRRRRQVQG